MMTIQERIAELRDLITAYWDAPFEAREIGRNYSNRLLDLLVDLAGKVAALETRANTGSETSVKFNNRLQDLERRVKKLENYQIWCHTFCDVKPPTPEEIRQANDARGALRQAKFFMKVLSDDPPTSAASPIIHDACCRCEKCSRLMSAMMEVNIPSVWTQEAVDAMNHMKVETTTAVSEPTPERNMPYGPQPESQSLPPAPARKVMEGEPIYVKVDRILHPGREYGCACSRWWWNDGRTRELVLRTDTNRDAALGALEEYQRGRSLGDIRFMWREDGLYTCRFGADDRAEGESLPLAISHAIIAHAEAQKGLT